MTLTATQTLDINEDLHIGDLHAQNTSAENVSAVTPLSGLTGFDNPAFSDAPTYTIPDELVWEDLALCRTVANAAELFFSEELHEIGAAKRVCAECPVIAACLEGAIRRAEPCGVWGGQLFENGKILTIKRKRGRPPKNPRPEDQIPMIPIPAHLEQLIA